LRVLASLAFAVASVVVVAPSCSNGGEGDRCSHLGDNNGNNDCQSGLVCKCAQGSGNSTTCPNGIVPHQTGGVDVCCPPNTSQATTAVCSAASNPLGGDAGPPCTGDACAPQSDAPEESTADAPAVDSSPPPDAPADAVDAPAESAPSDAPGDAPADSPAG